MLLIGCIASHFIIAGAGLCVAGAMICFGLVLIIGGAIGMISTAGCCNTGTEKYIRETKVIQEMVKNFLSMVKNWQSIAQGNNEIHCLGHEPERSNESLLGGSAGRQIPQPCHPQLTQKYRGVFDEICKHNEAQKKAEQYSVQSTEQQVDSNPRLS